jgi:hypothetical protein
MIISASRRTDVPAFYAEWFVQRVRAGYGEVPNPMNPRQVARVSLLPEEVDAIVFWTRNPMPLLSKLPELDALGLCYYFQFTLCGYGRPIEEQNPSPANAITAFKRLSSTVGPERVIWRYDPLVFSEATTADFHLKNFEFLSTALKGFTRRCVVSIWDNYRKLGSRLEALSAQGVHLWQPGQAKLDRLLPRLVELCAANGMEIVSCAEEVDLERYGVKRGKCVDDELIQRLFGFEVCHKKDGAQRPACGCVESRDIGMYNSCLFGCSYCYATTSFSTAATNRRKHNPDSASLIPTH